MSEQAPNPTIILIGCGQMGSAIARGLCVGGMDPTRLILVDADLPRQRELASELGARAGEGALESEDSERVYLVAVKPWYVDDVLSSLDFSEGDQVISVAAGVSLKMLRAWAGEEPVIVRTMPNTPCLIGEGVTGIFGEKGADLAIARWIFSRVGRVVELASEGQFDGLTAISGSGPAYVFTILEALADGGVLMGLDRDTARSLAVETLIGAARLARESDVHTAELKDRVASPAGATIAALRELERGNLRHTIINAVEAAAKKSKAMGE